METGELFERVAITFTRILMVASALLGFYLLLKDTSLLHKLFGIVLVWVGLFLILHHHLVISRGSMRGEDD